MVCDNAIIFGVLGRDPGDHRIRMQSIERPSDGLSWGKKPGEVVK